MKIKNCHGIGETLGGLMDKLAQVQPLGGTPRATLPPRLDRPEGDSMGRGLDEEVDFIVKHVDYCSPDQIARIKAIIEESL